MTSARANRMCAWAVLLRIALCGLLAVVAVALVGVGPARAAEAASPWWWAGSEVSPTNLPPEHEGEKGREGEGVIVAVASDLGDGPASAASGHPIVISDKLPAGLIATEITGAGRHAAASCSLASLQCTFTGVLYPYERLTVTINVKVQEPPGTVTTLPNQVLVEGGGAPRPASSTQQLRISGAPTPFGVQDEGYELAPYNVDGTPATTAGSHPFQLTSTLVMNQTDAGGSPEPAALPRNLTFRLPPGLVGDPGASEQCPSSDFFAHAPASEVDECPPGSAVGVATVTIDEAEFAHVITLTVPLFNLVPSEGEPARFGFEALGLVPVIIDTSVTPGGDYGVVAKVKDATAITGLLSSQVSFWGVPGDPRHNPSRGWECINNGIHYEKGEVVTSCPTSTSLPETPLLTLPSYCPVDPAGEPVSSTVELDSWAQQAYLKAPAYVWSGPLEEPLGFSGCQGLPFTPTISVRPEQHTASTPTGLDATVKLPQAATVEGNPEGRAEADVRDTTVTLPAGVQVNPSAANGLQACSEADIGFTGFEDFQPGSPTATFSEGFDFTPPSEPERGESFCPDASKIGAVRIKTPLLPQELRGAVYLAEPAPDGEPGRNPFGSLIALYLVAEDKQAGVLVKLAGEGTLNPESGQVTTSFENTPQLPFEELVLELFGGPRASLSTPALCGNFTSETKALFTAWSEASSEPLSESLFEVSAGAGGGSCPPDPLAFSASFLAASESTKAGAFSSFQLRLERPDGQQALSGLSTTLPPGVAAMLASVTPCPEPPAGTEWECAEDSLIGHSIAESGLGDDPVAIPGSVYLTSGYDGAPFGLLVRTLAKAGPFNLGYVNVRSTINVNPETAAVTIATDPGPRGEALPTRLKGIPVQLKRLQVDVDRPDFQFNPTSCEPMSVTATLNGAEGASVPVSSRFQVGGCQNLPFHPVLSASVDGHASKADGAAFDVRIESQGLGVANIRKVDLELPEQLPSRDSTLNKACLASVFDTNPAACSPESVIGHATVHTPVLKSPLSGPAYLVSHGGGAFPDVEFVLEGEGITLILDGKTDIKNGITYSKFETAPDAPFTTFETVLPAGPHSILGAYASEKEPYELCRSALVMPTTITAQDGAVIEQDTRITATGCSNVLASKTSKKPTLAQQLTKALATCRKKYTHSKHKRALCEKAARARYTPRKATRKPAHKTGGAAHHA